MSCIYNGSLQNKKNPWISGTQWQYSQLFTTLKTHYCAICRIYGVWEEVGTIESVWMSLAGLTEEMFELCSSLPWLRWDERGVHVKARKGWREINGLETYLESNNTSWVMTLHGLRVMGIRHHAEDAGEFGAMKAVDSFTLTGLTWHVPPLQYHFQKVTNHSFLTLVTLTI